MGDLLLWGADHIGIWRPFAIALLTGLVLGCAWYAACAWEARR